MNVGKMISNPEEEVRVNLVQAEMALEDRDQEGLTQTDLDQKGSVQEDVNVEEIGRRDPTNQSLTLLLSDKFY